MKIVRKLLKKRDDSDSFDAEITHSRELYQKALHTVQNMLDNSTLDIEKAQILDFAINIIGKDISYSVSARLLYTGKTPECATFPIPAPQDAYIGQGNYSLSELNVVIDTYDTEKLRKAIPSVQVLGFRQKMGYYTGILYPEIDLVVIINGRHHLASAIVQNSGSAKLDICSLKKVFPTLTTDGAYWYFPYTTPERVYDYRIAVLYELARMKHNLQLPEDLEHYTDPELPVPDSFDRISYHGEVYFRTRILELELRVKNYQLQILRGEKVPENFAAEIERLEKVTDDLRKEFRNWVSRVSGG